MFDKLIDLAVQLAQSVRCAAIVPQYEGGVVLRWGRYVRDAEPGLVWLLPVIDTLITESILPGTETTRVQSLTTDSGDDLTVSCAVTWRVSNPRRYLLGVQDGSNAVMDLLTGAVGEVVQRQGSDSDPQDLAKIIQTSANRRAARWGIHIDRLSFGTFTRARVFRLIQDREVESAD